MLVMALDVGTSSARARCFDAGGRGLEGADARVAYEPLISPDGGVELDADALLDAVAGSVDGCLARAGAAGRGIAAVGISAFWHGLLGLDGAGRLLTPVITWADTRSAGAAAELRGVLDGHAVHARTGAPLHAAFHPAKLRWLRGARPDVFRRARTWCGFAEYLARRLTGRCSVSVSMASGTGLLDQETKRWDPALLEACGIDPDRLPAIDDEPAAGLVGSFASRWPALAGAAWFPAWGDGACSSVGSGCRGPERIALNVGTSSALRVVTPTVPLTPSGLWRYRVDGARSLVGGATSEGGNVFAWARRTLWLPGDDVAIDQALSALPPDAHGLTALPFLAGERSPGWRDDARAALAGLRLGTSPIEILRALLEAVAFRLAIIHERLAPLAAPGYEVVASGGGLLHSRTWTRIIADVLGRPLTLSPEAEASSRGAALLALERLGLPAPPPGPTGSRVTPDPRRHAIYLAARARHQRLYDGVVGGGLS